MLLALLNRVPRTRTQAKGRAADVRSRCLDCFAGRISLRKTDGGRD
jgi:hypothetical protein